MRLRHIEVFNAVMQTGSVSAAARLINVTQPAVSRTLQHAELQLGFALFERARGRLTPTNEAMALFPHVEKLYEQLDEVQRLAAGLRHGAVTDRLQVLTVFALSREVLPHAVAGFLQALPAFPALRVRGLMTLALFSADVARVRPCFVRLRELRERLRDHAPAGVSLEELSMGMSGDFELAIAEGATVVRVGQAIFGARALPDSHYWPGEGG